MFSSNRYGAKAYSMVGLESGVLGASPHKLIVMLFDGALAAIANARHHIVARHIVEKSTAIDKAATIIESGLRASLNKEVGGALALTLDTMYHYLCQRLLQANLTNDVEILDEVSLHLRDLRDAWNAIEHRPDDGVNRTLK
ncbi:flagellar export chaperone FliS [Noviherbaspirillum malthae]|uniref:flagellar export chaperone FliS n=1 Tax=Noviherbaspirillum malthae TaxID=1260987 RepID=UPI00188EC7DF|nr:flagellar export chaperone FliS [Noviherbaspirillum malthae]